MKKKLALFILIILSIGAGLAADAFAGAQEDALIAASAAGNVAEMKQALDKGADVNAMDKDGHTALMLACSAGHSEVVKMLLEKGSDPNLADKDGKTAFMMAAEKGHVEAVMEISRYLVGPAAADQGAASASPPPTALDDELVVAASDGDVNKVQQLLDQGANLEAKDENIGGTCLLWACMKGHAGVAELIIRRGANIHAVDNDGRTAMMWAANQGHSDVVALLIEQQADVHASDKEGWTALTAGLAQGHNEACEILKKAGALENWGDAVVESADAKQGCLRVRKGPAASDKQVDCVKRHEKLKLTGIWSDNNWAQISDPVEGWVDASKIKLDGPAPKKEVLKVGSAEKPARQEAPRVEERPQRSSESSGQDEAAVSPGGGGHRPGQVSR